MAGDLSVVAPEPAFSLLALLIIGLMVASVVLVIVEPGRGPRQPTPEQARRDDQFLLRVADVRCQLSSWGIVPCTSLARRNVYVPVKRCLVPSFSSAFTVTGTSI